MYFHNRIIFPTVRIIESLLDDVFVIFTDAFHIIEYNYVQYTLYMLQSKTSMN